MGLDMYLEARKTIYKSDPDFETAKNLREKYGVPSSDNLDFVRIFFEVAYWRKANQIHKWFVDNCADGNDDCRSVHVSRGKLLKLLDTIETVLREKNLAQSVMPTQGGFFFGSTDYDDYYWDDLVNTRTKIKQLLENKGLERFDFYYQASW